MNGRTKLSAQFTTVQISQAVTAKGPATTSPVRNQLRMRPAMPVCEAAW